jgi:hypothetical protein
MEKHRHNGDLAMLTLLFLRKLAKNCFTVAREVQVPLCPHGHTFIHDIPDRSSDCQSEGKQRDAPQGTGPTMTERLAMNTRIPVFAHFVRRPALGDFVKFVMAMNGVGLGSAVAVVTVYRLKSVVSNTKMQDDCY